ncbi:MAG: biotin--[acetyl-CoA-carboxylase] ligase, partial [Alphaproteobacteria bacterium]|nr:biotin--[acetyl-CoA-carboxylase] ligase [Alphaproteobacteria bacterium]
RRGREGAPDLTLVVAGEQTGGRGRRGRPWRSPPGNLYASLLLRPGCPAQRLPEIGFVAAVAAAEACDALLAPARVELKWPNDLLVGGAKVGGILLETEGAADAERVVALGIGINIACAPEGMPYPAACLSGITGAPVPLAGVRDGLARRFVAWYARWRDEGFAPVRAAWIAHAPAIGRPLAVRVEKAVLEGAFAGIDEAGALILDLPAGDRRRVLAGDVLFAAA